MKRSRLIHNIIILLFVTAVIVLSGCSKDSTQGWIVGKWYRVKVENVDTTYSESWEFNAGGSLRICCFDYMMTDTAYYYGTYSVDSYDMFTINVPDDPYFALLNGVWQVVKREDNYMMAVFDVGQLEGAGLGLTFREFQR